jgi:hypothetical protein
VPELGDGATDCAVSEKRLQCSKLLLANPQQKATKNLVLCEQKNAG